MAAVKIAESFSVSVLQVHVTPTTSCSHPAFLTILTHAVAKTASLLFCMQEGVVGGGGGDAAGGGSSSSGCVGRWLLEGLVEGGACYLWEPSSGRVFSDPPEGQWPRPVGEWVSGLLTHSTSCVVVCVETVGGLVCLARVGCRCAVACRHQRPVRAVC